MAEIIIPQGWTLVTASTQAELDAQLPYRESVAKAVHLHGIHEAINVFNKCRCGAEHDPGWNCCGGCDAHNDWHEIGWLIVSGGERPLHPAWVRSLHDQCQEAGVPFCFTGWGEWGPYADIGTMQLTEAEILGDKMAWVAPDGAWSTEKIKPYVFGEGTVLMSRVGAAKSGRTLDGKVWDEKPKELIHDAC